MSDTRLVTDHAVETAVRLSAVVMTHPSRLTRATALCARHPDLGLRVVVDPDPGAGPSALRTARLAWAAADPTATHHLVVQDDAILVPDAAARIGAAVAQRPGDAISLFTEWGSVTASTVRLAALTGAAWAEVTEHYTPTVAAVLPVALAHGFAAFGTDAPQDDVALRAYLLGEGVAQFVPVPNLADHDPGVSLTGNDVMGARRSVCFLPDAAPVGGGTVRPDVLPYFSWFEGRALCYVRADPAGAGWRRELPAWFFAHHGIDAATVTAAGRDRVRRDAAGPVPPIMLFGLWLTACQLGVSAGAAADPATPVAAEALRTLPWGGLRRFCTTEQVTAAEPVLAALVADGVTFGRGLR
jgi:hypothetical protein